MTRFEEALQHYRANMGQILAAGSSAWGVDPYEWECFTRMTPIESALWSAIREIGIVMYPQFPIGPFFADFCNPVAKVVIECDGAAWHQDKEKDDRRQKFIEEQGYTVLRITGKQCLDESYALEFIRSVAASHRVEFGKYDWCVAIDHENKRLVVARMDDVYAFNENALLDGGPGLAVVRANRSEQEVKSFASLYSPVYRMKRGAFVEMEG